MFDQTGKWFRSEDRDDMTLGQKVIARDDAESSVP